MYDNIRELIEDIKNSIRPCILVGGGANGAIRYIESISNYFSIPLLRTWNAKDIVTNDMKMFVGDVGTYCGLGRNFAVQNCDLIICLGTRISGRITGGNPESFARAAKKWVIDIDDSNEDYLKSQGISYYKFIKSDCEHFCKLLFDSTQEPFTPNESVISWYDKCVAWRDKYDPVLIHKDVETSTVNPYLFMRELSEQCSSNDVIVSDCGGNQVIFAHAFKTKKGQICFTNNGNSPMGFSMAGAIGAWFAKQNISYDKYDSVSNPTPEGNPAGNVICIIGDGGMQMNIQELQTIKNYAVNIKIFILNNAIYGITKAFQKVNFEGRAEACESPHYTVPDFTRISNSYLIKHMSIFNNNMIEDQIKWVLNCNRSVICDVKCDDWHSYLPKVSGWDQSIEDMEPYLSNDEFLSNMIINISESSKRNRGL